MDTITTPLDVSELNQISDNVQTTRFMNQIRDDTGNNNGSSPLKGAARQYYNKTITENSATNGRNQSHM